MGLTKEQIQTLLAKKTRATGPRKPKGPDTSVRDYGTWFKLQHRMFDLETNSDVMCANPDCIDPRPGKKTAMGLTVKSQSCARVDGVDMCRYCFLDGYKPEIINE